MKKLDALKDRLLLLQKYNAPKEEIAEVEQQIVRSKRGRSSKTKGANYERTIAKKFMEKFPELKLVRTPLSGGFNKSVDNAKMRGDISNLNEEYEFMLHLELKNQSTVKMFDWIKQAEEDCPTGHVPCVVFHKQQKNEDGKRVQEAKDYVCLSLEDFLNIVKKEVVSQRMDIEMGKLIK
jgi:hypothetical protein